MRGYSVLAATVWLVMPASAVLAPTPAMAAEPAAESNYYSSFWKDSQATVTYRNGRSGNYSVQWSGNKGNFVAGKGWNPGSKSRVVTIAGEFDPHGGNGYLSVYGWTTSPLVEYYIVEAYGSHKPCSGPQDNATHKGNVTVDGSIYEIWTKTRRNKPSIVGTATFAQYFSIRSEQRVGGTVHVGEHFAAFEAAGLQMGRHNYMIVATEGQDSNGTATIEVGSE